MYLKKGPCKSFAEHLLQKRHAFLQILAVAESRSTDVVYYLPSQTDDGSMGDDGTLMRKLMMYRLEDDGLTEG